MARLYHVIGDATEPIKRPALITHVNNDKGGWGRGFVLAVSKKFPEAEKAYREWFQYGFPSLGDTQLIQVSPDIWVGNMIAQHDTVWQGSTPPIRYDALERCLRTAYLKANHDNLTIAMPRIGADLAGGDWSTIEGIIRSVMVVDTYVYTLEKQKDRWPTKYDTISEEK